MGAMTPEELKRELQGWYLYDFANSAFFQAAATVRRARPKRPRTESYPRQIPPLVSTTNGTKPLAYLRPPPL